MPRGHRYANAQQKNGNYAEENNIFQGIEEVCSLGLVESITRTLFCARVVCNFHQEHQPDHNAKDQIPAETVMQVLPVW